MARRGAAPDGLWERSAAEYLDFAVEHGFNALRLPLAVNHVLSDPPVDRWFTREWAPADEHGAYPSPPLRSLEVVERVVTMAAARGLLVMLDVHRLNASVWPDPRGLWYDAENARPSARLDVVAAAWAQGHWNAFAADLFNEPWGGTWSDEEWDDESGTDWPAAASALGDAVLAACPRWLVFIEGVGNTASDCELCFWGENLKGLQRAPNAVQLPAERVVYSPHVYGPGTSPEMWYFNRTAFNNFPHNLDAVWREHWLDPARTAGATLVVGEWGGVYEGDDAEWQETFKTFLLEHHLSSFYWCATTPPPHPHHSTSTSSSTSRSLNPNSGDTKGLLLDDWRTPHAAKLALLSDLPSTPVLPLLASVAAAPCDEAAVAAGRAFRCGKGEAAGALCVHAEQVCNGVDECPDRTDEGKKACKAAGRAQPCVTIGGQQPLRPCKLPFVYLGIEYTGCSLDDTIDGEPWCPTAVDEGGAYASFSEWGICGPGCPKAARRLDASSCEGGIHPGENDVAGLVH